MREKSVYVLESQIGTIKIGCSYWPEKRAELISGHSPCPVRLIAVIEGGHAKERALHKQFEGYLCHNEWFRVEGDLSRFVSEVFGCGVPSVATWNSFGAKSRADRLAEANARKGAAAKARWADPDYRARLIAAAKVRKSFPLTYRAGGA